MGFVDGDSYAREVAGDFVFDHVFERDCYCDDREVVAHSWPGRCFVKEKGKAIIKRKIKPPSINTKHSLTVMSEKLHEPIQTADTPQLEQLFSLLAQQEAPAATQGQSASFDLTSLVPGSETPARSVETDFSPPQEIELEFELPDSDMAPTSGRTQLAIAEVKTAGVDTGDNGGILLAHGNRGDRHRLQIEAWFDMSTGILVVSRYDTEQSHTLFAPQHIVVDGYYSGTGDYRNDPNATDEQNKGPLPLGRYHILYHPRADFWRLDFDDGRTDDIVGTGPGRGRNNFRLHKPGGSIGCITTSSGDEENWSEWEKIDALIRSADPILVRDHANASELWTNRQYGILNVTNGGLPRNVQDIIDDHR